MLQVRRSWTSFQNVFKDKFNLNKEGYRLAFNFESEGGKNLNDPRYVKTLVRLSQYDGK